MSLDATDKLTKCKRVDITGNDTRVTKSSLPSVPELYEKIIWEKEEDKRKPARVMKDSWDSATRKVAESHVGFSVFGLHFVEVLQTRLPDRLWQTDLCDLSVQASSFRENGAACCRCALKTTHLVAEEV